MEFFGCSKTSHARELEKNLILMVVRMMVIDSGEEYEVLSLMEIANCLNHLTKPIVINHYK